MSTPRKGMSIGVMIALAIAIATAVTVGQARSETVRFPNTAEARFSVTVTGSGPDVILIPGLGGSRDVWDATVARYKDTHRLHVLNISGFAGEPTAANGSGDAIAPSVAALHAYITDKKLTSPTVVGHSMGGLMALMLARSYPDAAGKLVIVDALPFVSVIFNPAATPDIMKPTATAIRDSMIKAPADAFAAQQNADAGRLTVSQAHQKIVADWTIASDRRVFANAFYEDMLIDLRPNLQDIRTPTVVIFPYDESAGQTAAANEAFYGMQYSGMTKAQFSGVGGSRHFIMLDQPAAFHAAMDKALK